MQELPKNGKMAVVFAGPETVASAISAHVDQVAIAALNGPENTVISGDGKPLEEFSHDSSKEALKPTARRIPCVPFPPDGTDAG